MRVTCFKSLFSFTSSGVTKRTDMPQQSSVCVGERLVDHIRSSIDVGAGAWVVLLLTFYYRLRVPGADHASRLRRRI